MLGSINNHQMLTNVLGGDWWQGILWNDTLTTDYQAKQIVNYYTSQLKVYYPYTGYCPVREREGSRIKYYITFCSRHPDALKLHNDNMCNAYNHYIVSRNWDESSFQPSRGRTNHKDMSSENWMHNQLLLDLTRNRNWHDDIPRDYNMLDNLILNEVEALNRKGDRPSREEVWVQIIMQPQYFMRWLQSEYRERIQRLVKEKHGRHLGFVDVKGTGRLNDESRLYVIEE